MLPIIMQHGVIERVDTLEVFSIERVLGTNAMSAFSPEIGPQ
jgi:hypothetical protein